MNCLCCNNKILSLQLTLTCVSFAVIKSYDDECEGLGRRAAIEMVKAASGHKLTREQASRTWDRTVLPLGRDLGLLTGYVKPQDDTSKRTAAGAVEHQKKWHAQCDSLIAKVRHIAMMVLQDEELVHELLSWLIFNLDEECLHALGKNSSIVGSKDKKKHDSQDASSRSASFFFCIGDRKYLSSYYQLPPGAFFIS